MATFINLNISDPSSGNNLKKHLIYASLWILNILVLLFRIDIYLFKSVSINKDLMGTIIPYAVIVIDVILFFKQKWYYNLAFIFYPFLTLFWFIPKWILKKGKIYLFIYYFTSIFGYWVAFKKALLQSSILILIIILLSTTSNDFVRLISIVYFSFLFFKTLYKYIVGSFKNKLNSNSKKIQNSNTFSKLNLVESIENQKIDEKLSPEQNTSKKIEMMVLWNYFLQYVSNNVNSYRGKRAFMIVWFFQYFLYFFLTIFFFTFLNYELFQINSNNFIFSYPPSVFDFFYYTIKTVTFSSIDSLKPISTFSRIAEISSFFILSIYFLIITISSILSLKMSEYSKEMEDAIILCQLQNEKIKEHLKTKYDTDISKAISEIETINTATIKLKLILERIL